MTVKGPAALTAREKEIRVMAAVALAGYVLADVREQCPWLTDREFRTVMRDLVTRRAIVRVGSGAEATVRRDFGAWHK